MGTIQKVWDIVPAFRNIVIQLKDFFLTQYLEKEQLSIVHNES